jgi:hypothetical protein
MMTGKKARHRQYCGSARALVIILAASLIAGCSQTVETRISSAGLSAPAAARFVLADSKAATPELRHAQMLVTDALLAHGFQPGDAATLHLEITVADRPAALALGTAAGPGSLSPAKRKKPLQSCEDREYRIGVALTRIADGMLIYQANAAEYHCKLKLAEALPDLVQAALADFGTPRGAYARRRTARD